MIQADAAVSTAAQIPGALEVVIPVGLLCGAVGAFAADLATDAGKLERFRSDTAGWSFGFAGKIIVGAVAAVVILTLNPPGESWLSLIGTALAAGIGGDAVVVSFVATGRVEAAERRTQDVAMVGMSQLDEVAQSVQTSSPRARGEGLGDPDAPTMVLEKVRSARAALQTYVERGPGLPRRP